MKSFVEVLSVFKNISRLPFFRQFHHLPDDLRID